MGSERSKKGQDNNFSFDEGSGSSDNKESDLDIAQFGDDFFEALDRQHNGAILEVKAEAGASDDNKSGNSAGVGQKESGKGDDDPELVDKDLQSLKARYEASSREAKRLSDKLKQIEQYEPFLPVLDAMNTDPQLLNMVRDHLAGNLSPQSAIKELNLGEDFLFDLQEAMEDPASDSAKALQAYTDRIVDQKLARHTFQENQRKQAETKEQAAAREFMEKYKIDEKQYQEFVDWAKGEPLTLDHLWTLKNLNKRDQKLINSHLAERQAHLDKMHSTHQRSLAGASADGSQPSVEDQLFKLMTRLDEEDNLFK